MSPCTDAVHPLLICASTLAEGSLDWCAAVGLSVGRSGILLDPNRLLNLWVAHNAMSRQAEGTCGELCCAEPAEFISFPLLHLS